DVLHRGEERVRGVRGDHPPADDQDDWHDHRDADAEDERPPLLLARGLGRARGGGGRRLDHGVSHQLSASLRTEVCQKSSRRSTIRATMFTSTPRMPVTKMRPYIEATAPDCWATEMSLPS